VTREVALALLAGWLDSWAAEERALEAAERARVLEPQTIHDHLVHLRGERELVRPLLSGPF